MCRRTFRLLLLIAGCILLFTSVFPVLLFLHLDESLQTAFIGSKLFMLPLGAFCLLGSAALQMKHR